MLRLITSHAQLRTSAVPRWIRKDLYNRLPIRCKSTPAAPNKISGSAKRTNPPKASPLSPPRTTPKPRGSRTGKEPPHRILIYHGGTGRTVFIGVMRITTIFVFGVSCLVVAPAFFAADYPWYTAPAIVAFGAIPMLFVAYTASPFVNYVHLATPAFARRSREEILKYAKNLPPTSTLYINTMKFTTIPRRTEVRLSDLAPGQAALRPVNLINTNPEKQAWWKGKAITKFYASGKSKSTKATSTFYPEVWDYVYGSIRKNRSPPSKIFKGK
ncbi:hypothetical protein FQN54_005979 [Arachnomyces sp. PD_36]|nr:hypothetical protein FQN54_005979 [Arachnomyces sp. PD_36]